MTTRVNVLTEDFATKVLFRTSNSEETLTAMQPFGSEAPSQLQRFH